MVKHAWGSVNMLAVGFLFGSTMLPVTQPFLLYQGEFIDTFIMYSSAVFMDLVIRKLKVL